MDEARGSPFGPGSPRRARRARIGARSAQAWTARSETSVSASPAGPGSEGHAADERGRRCGLDHRQRRHPRFGESRGRSYGPRHRFPGSEWCRAAVRGRGQAAVPVCRGGLLDSARRSSHCRRPKASVGHIMNRAAGKTSPSFGEQFLPLATVLREATAARRSRPTRWRSCTVAIVALPWPMPAIASSACRGGPRSRSHRDASAAPSSRRLAARGSRSAGRRGRSSSSSRPASPTSVSRGSPTRQLMASSS